MGMLHLPTDIWDVKVWNLAEFLITGRADMLRNHGVVRGGFADIVLNIAQKCLAVFSARLGNAYDLLYFGLDRAPVTRHLQMQMAGGLISELIL